MLWQPLVQGMWHRAAKVGCPVACEFPRLAHEKHPLWQLKMNLLECVVMVNVPDFIFTGDNQCRAKLFGYKIQPPLLRRRFTPVWVWGLIALSSTFALTRDGNGGRSGFSLFQRRSLRLARTKNDSGDAGGRKGARDAIRRDRSGSRIVTRLSSRRRRFRSAIAAADPDQRHSEHGDPNSSHIECWSIV